MLPGRCTLLDCTEITELNSDIKKKQQQQQQQQGGRSLEDTENSTTSGDNSTTTTENNTRPNTSSSWTPLDQPYATCGAAQALRQSHGNVELAICRLFSGHQEEEGVIDIDDDGGLFCFLKL